MISRRVFITQSAKAVGGLGAVHARPTILKPLARVVSGVDASYRSSEISAWYTNARQRFTKGAQIGWHPAPDSPPIDSVRFVATNKFQEVLGFGGCFSDASCYVINQLRQPLRDELLHELCHPSEMALNVHRTCMGAADSAAMLYSYDEGEPDPDLKRFSIDHDREYILPILRRVFEINPSVFLFASPWSPPGWMKWNKSMLGGSMSRQYLSSYAQYFLKFVRAYAEAGVPLQAVTTQNEVDTDQHGQMPACTWSQECETEFVIEHLGPLFEKSNVSTKIWILDHNYVYWGRVISQLDNPDFRRYASSVAWHGYVGEPSMMSKVHAAHPEADMHFTEGSTDYNDPHYTDDWTKWASTYTDVLNNWCSSATAWNVATDEHGKPNIGPYPCGGILIINPRTQEIVRSGQYWALAHFSRTLRRGAMRCESQGQVANLSHIAFQNPEGENVVVLTNSGAARTVEIIDGLQSATIPMEGNSVSTLCWKSVVI